MDVEAPVENKPKKRSAGAGVLVGVLLWIACVIGGFWVASVAFALLEAKHEIAAVVLAYIPMPVFLGTVLLVYVRKARKGPSPYLNAVVITLSVAFLLLSACDVFMLNK